MKANLYDRPDAFTRAYLHAMAFTTDPDPGAGEYPMPDLRRFAPDVISKALQDCEAFQTANRDHYLDHLQSLADEEHAGRDFWYTRNGHGCGFWDGDWPEPAASRLTTAAEAFGEVYVELRRGKFRS